MTIGDAHNDVPLVIVMRWKLVGNLATFEIPSIRRRGGYDRVEISLENWEKDILCSISYTNTIADISKKTELPINKTLSFISELEKKGVVTFRTTEGDIWG